MQLTHDTECQLAMTVALVNSAPEIAGEERLDTVAALRAFVAEHRISGVRRVTTADLAAVQALRVPLRRVFTTSDLRSAVAVVNRLVADARALPQLTDHDGQVWHLHFTPPQAALAHRLAADAGMGLAVVIRDDGLARLRTCDADDCDAVLVDTSRNRSRRYCDAGNCGNRLHVAAYRARRRAAGEAGTAS